MPTPVHFRVVDPAGLSFSGLEHRRYGHHSYDRINATRRLQGLPALRKPPAGWRCAICELSNARVKDISKGHKRPEPAHRCTCSVCQLSSKARPPEKPGESISMDLFGPSRAPSVDGSVYGCVNFLIVNPHRLAISTVFAVTPRSCERTCVLPGHCELSELLRIPDTDAMLERSSPVEAAPLLAAYNVGLPCAVSRPDCRKAAATVVSRLFRP